MKTTIHLQSAYVLHARPYRETSAWLELFTFERGRMSVLVKGIRGSKTPLKAILQPFVPVLVSFRGQGDNWLLTHAESRGVAFFLKGKALLSGFYLNELLVRLLGYDIPAPTIFQIYEKTLSALQNELAFIKFLRIFEKNMLQALGYELRLTHEARSLVSVEPDKNYVYHLEEGPVLAAENPHSSHLIVRGKTLHDLHAEILEDPISAKEAKYLLRAAINFQLGDKPLRTRALFRV